MNAERPAMGQLVDWNGARVVRFIPLRRVLNFWRLRAHDEEGLRVTYYATRRGVVILSVTAVVA